MSDMSPELDSPFLRNRDLDNVEGPARDLVGYGENPPRISWPGNARLAINVVVNIEEGSEKSYAMGDNVNEEMHELPFHQYVSRDLAKESFFEYGSRAGIWRLFRVFGEHDIPATMFASAVALERNPEVANKIVTRGDDVVGHGYRWSNHFEMTREEERASIRSAVESITQMTGSRPLGWYCREMSPNTRELLVEEGGFVYDSDNYSDDLPYWTYVAGRPHLVLPYSLTTNDARYVLGTGFTSPDDFYATGKAAVDRLLNDGDDCARMLSIGLHPRISGNPARADGLARLISYCRNLDGVVFMRRIDMARVFSEQVPPATTK